MPQEFRPVRWQEVEGLPEGARVQNDRKARLTSAFFPYYYRDADGQSKAERDYIGTVVDGKFVPNAYYTKNRPTRDNRPPERWRDPGQREKALRRGQGQSSPLPVDWFDLELAGEKNVTRQVGASALCARILYEGHWVEDVARALKYDVAATMHALNLATLLALTAKASYLTVPEAESCKLIGSGCPAGQDRGPFLAKIGADPELPVRICRLRMRRLPAGADLLSMGTAYPDGGDFHAPCPQDLGEDACPGPRLKFGILAEREGGGAVGYFWRRRDLLRVRTPEEMERVWAQCGIEGRQVELVCGQASFHAPRLPALTQAGIRYIAGVPVNVPAIQGLVANSRFLQAGNLLARQDCFGVSCEVTLGQAGKTRAHAYFSPDKYMAEARSLAADVERAKAEWEAGEIASDAPAAGLLLDPVPGERPETDAAAFERECRVRGLFACVTNTDQPMDTVLEKCRMRGRTEAIFQLLMRRLLEMGRADSDEALEGMMLVAFLALAILGRLHVALRGLPRPEARAGEAFGFGRAGGSEVTVAGVLHALQSVSVTVDRRGQAQLSNLSDRKLALVERLGFGGLFASGKDVCELLSARRLSETVRALEAEDRSG